MAMGLPAVVWDFLFYRNLLLDGETGLRHCAGRYRHNDRPDFAAGRRSAHGGALGSTNARALLSSRYDWHSLARTIVTELETVGHAA
jgi:hypothetical protein